MMIIEGLPQGVADGYKDDGRPTNKRDRAGSVIHTGITQEIRDKCITFWRLGTVAIIPPKMLRNTFNMLACWTASGRQAGSCSGMT